MLLIQLTGQPDEAEPIPPKPSARAYSESSAAQHLTSVLYLQLWVVKVEWLGTDVGNSCFNGLIFSRHHRLPGLLIFMCSSNVWNCRAWDLSVHNMTE